MAVRDFRELTAWQAADALRRGVVAATAGGSVARDFKFVDQIRRAANSACANIAEGFGRYQHREFAQFLSIAKGSLAEVQDHVTAGEAMGYWPSTTARELDAAATRAIKLTTALIRYLRHSKAPAT